MKTTSQIIVFASCLTTLTACVPGLNSCPENQYLGRLQLTKPSFSPYRGNETLRFQNQTGRQLSLTNFESANVATPHRLVLSVPCYYNDLIKQERYYDSPRLNVSYRVSPSDNLNSLEYSFGIQDMRLDQTQGDTLLAEELTIYNNFNRPNTSLRVLVSDRGNRSRFDASRGQYPRLVAYRLISDTLIHNRSYQQVYCSQGSPTLFFTQAQGIIAFRDGQEWWYQVP